jgi:hypothetical protein
VNGYLSGCSSAAHGTRVSNRSQLRPPFRAQSRPLFGSMELRGMVFAGWEAVGKWPTGATVESLA